MDAKFIGMVGFGITSNLLVRNAIRKASNERFKNRFGVESIDEFLAKREEEFYRNNPQYKNIKE